jgi:hypothetical protein
MTMQKVDEFFTATWSVHHVASRRDGSAPYLMTMVDAEVHSRDEHDFYLCPLPEIPSSTIYTIRCSDYPYPHNLIRQPKIVARGRTQEEAERLRDEMIPVPWRLGNGHEFRDWIQRRYSWEDNG